MNIGSKLQDTDAAEINRGSIHELWEGGDSTRTFTAAEGWPRALRVDAAGTLIMTDQDDISVTYNVLQGELIPFAPKTINTSSTADVQIIW